MAYQIAGANKDAVIDFFQERFSKGKVAESSNDVKKYVTNGKDNRSQAIRSPSSSVGNHCASLICSVLLLKE